MDKLQIQIPKPNESINSLQIMEIANDVISRVHDIDDFDELEELRLQAAALEKYLKGKELQKPMLGAQRQIEARIGQLLGDARKAQLAGRPLSHELKVERPNDRYDFRILAKGFECLPAKEDWEKSRRFLVADIKHRLGIVDDYEEFKYPAIVERADYKDWLLKQDQCDLLITDPPYMTDVDDINKFANEWLPLALSKIKSTGRAYIFIGAYPEELQAYLNIIIPNQILVWTYRNTLGPVPSFDYKMNWQAILYYRLPDSPPLNNPITKTSMLEQFAVQNISAPDGRQANRFHEWQKPSKIAELFIRHSTKPDDLVLDPFCCTGTFLIEASKLGRKSK